MKAAVIYNHSLKSMFGGYAEEISEALTSEGFETVSYTNHRINLLPETEIDLDCAVFFDKDILCGLRLERLGVRLYNNIGAIETCDDKRRTFEALNGISPMPETVFMPLLFNLPDGFAETFSDELCRKLSLPVIAKKAFGSLGRDVFLLSDRDSLIRFITENYRAPVLFSRFVSESRGRDLRVYVVGGRIAAAMLRENGNDFRSNIALGGHGTPFEPDSGVEELCISTANALALDFCGIDLLFENGKPSLVCEVNSNAMFGEINRVCRVNIAKEIAAYIAEDRKKAGQTAFGNLFGI